MKIIKYLQVAGKSIVAHRMRAILTMLGIIIGVAAVLVTMGIGRGAASNITARIASQGTNLLTISPGASSSGGVSGESGSAGTLTMGDVEALLDSELHPAVAYVAPEYGDSAQLVYNSNNSQSTITGVATVYATVHNLTVASGRFLSEEEVEGQSQVVVICTLCPPPGTRLIHRGWSMMVRWGWLTWTSANRPPWGSPAMSMTTRPSSPLTAAG
jgi:putative ABC transport system permease protein